MDWIGILIGTLSGGVVLFLWNGLAWMGLPHHMGDFEPHPKREDLEAAIQDLPLRSAFYSIPHFKEFEGGMKSKEFSERMAKGPNAILVLAAPQAGSQAPVFLRALLLDFLEAFGLALALSFLLPAIGDRISTRLALSLGLALFASFPLLANLSNWMGFPWRFALTSTFDKCVGYTLLALTFYLLGTGAPL